MNPGDVYGDLREADLTRNIASKLIPHLKKQGYIVMAVPLDLPLLQRIDWINNTGYRESLNDICVEIHVNSGGKRGIETWYKGEGNNKSQSLAEKLATSVSTETGYHNNGAKSEYQHELGSLSFLNRTNPITVIIECLYLDNQEDIAILKDDSKLDSMALAVANGIKGYLNQGTQTPTAQTTPAPVPAPPAPIPNTYQPPATTQPPNLGHNTNPPKPAGTSFTPPPPPKFGSNITPSNSFGANKFGGGAPGGGGLMQDREKRKEVINKRYTQILGREPSQSDLNYFLNIGINEDDLIKRMIDSQEHVDLVKAKQELGKIKDELEKTKSELIKHRSDSKESEQMITNLNMLITEKNNQIRQMGGIMASSGMTTRPIYQTGGSYPTPTDATCH